MPLQVLQNQARSLGIPLLVRAASWEEYTRVFSEVLREFKSKGLDIGVFGDIDIEGHLQWVESVCKPIGIKPYHPLWQQSRKQLLTDFLEAGFKATIVVVEASKLDKSFWGVVSAAVLEEIEAAGADAAGENSEYHRSAPMADPCSTPVPDKLGELFEEDGYCFINLG